jgi:hypothetical protein
MTEPGTAAKSSLASGAAALHSKGAICVIGGLIAVIAIAASNKNF